LNDFVDVRRFQTLIVNRFNGEIDLGILSSIEVITSVSCDDFVRGVQRGEAVQDSVLHTVAADVYGWLKVCKYSYTRTNVKGKKMNTLMNA